MQHCGSFFNLKMRSAEGLFQEITGLTVIIKRNYWRTGDAWLSVPKTDMNQ